MGDITDKHLEWLEGLGVNTQAAKAAPPTAKAAPPGGKAGSAGAQAGPSAPQTAPKGTPDVPSPYADPKAKSDVPFQFNPLKPVLIDPITMDFAARQRAIEEAKPAAKKAAEAQLAKIYSALDGVEKYINGLSNQEMADSSYVQIMTEARRRYPELVSLPQWLKNTAANVEGLKLPRPQVLMDVVDKCVQARGKNSTWGTSAGNLSSVNTDHLLAAYLTELPSGVGIGIKNNIVQLNFKGAALKVPVPGGEVEATADKGGAKLELKDYDVTIKIENDGWEEFDPKLRGEWKKIEGDATTLVTLKADKDQAKVELEKSKNKKGDDKVTADLTVKYDKLEADFNLEWTRLQQQVKVTAQASEEKIGASVAYLKKDANDKESVKAGIEAEVELKKLQAKVKAYYASPSVKAVLDVAAAADKVTAKLEVTAVKSGTVVTANFEKALDEIKAGIAIATADKKLTLAAEMTKKAEEITGKLEIVKKEKDLKVAAEIEKTLKAVRAAVEVEYKPKGGKTVVAVGANVDDKGKAGGKAKIDLLFDKGTSLVSGNSKISLSADVSNVEYKVGVGFSMGEPVTPESIDTLVKTVEQQMKELYSLVGEKDVRSLEDVTALNKRLEEKMKPVRDALDKAQTLRKPEISARFGFEIAGEWPKAGKAPVMSGTFSATITF